MSKMQSTFAAMKVLDSIKNRLSKIGNHTLFLRTGMYGVPIELTKHKFGEAAYLNILQLLTDIYAEVEWSSPTETPMYKAWEDFVNRNGQRILTQLLNDEGYIVVGYHSEELADGRVWSFYQLPTSAYSTKTIGNRIEVYCYDKEQLFYVIKSPTFEQTGKGDHEWCKPFIAMLDAVLNGATTTAERLGAYVVMSPKNDNFGGTINKDEKKVLEDELQQDYGMLGKQRQMMVLTRPMDSQVVSLASVDTKMNEKYRAAVLGIADRLKVPANQIAMIDANSSKALSNGSELREGDIAKYRSFRRLLNATLYDMATELGMRVDYTIENEPKTIQGQTIENTNI